MGDDMRTWIYNRIKAISGLPAGLADKIISSGSAENPAPPFILVSMGVEQKPLGMPAESRTQSIPFTVWVHDKPGSMLQIDDVAKLLKDNLPTLDGAVVGSMSIYQLVWEETGQDAYDDHFGTNARPVRFSMMTKH